MASTDVRKHGSAFSKSVLRDGCFFGIGNPLLDISAQVDPEIMRNYNLRPGDSILARDEHEELFKRLLNELRSRYSAGGFTQNIMRTITWFLKQPRVATYMGCVGQDHYHDLLNQAAENDGLTTAYQVNPNLSTGKCAMLLTPNSRAMVTSLGASEEFSVKQLVNSDWAYIEKAQIICSEDYFIGSSPEAFLKVAQYAHSEQKTFCMTLSAKFIAGKRLGGWLLCALQYADFVFGYEEATKVFGRTHLDVESDDIHTIAIAIRNSPKLNEKKPRIVLITKIPERTLVVTDDDIREYVWKKPATIRDIYGCGEAFIGGFLSYVALRKTIDECVHAGLYCAYQCLNQIGCQFSPDVSYDPEIFFRKINT